MYTCGNSIYPVSINNVSAICNESAQNFTYLLFHVVVHKIMHPLLRSGQSGQLSQLHQSHRSDQLLRSGLWGRSGQLHQLIRSGLWGQLGQLHQSRRLDQLHQ